MLPPKISEEEFQGWLTHPVTGVLWAILGKWTEALKSDWAAGRFSVPGENGTALISAKAIGECQGFERVRSIEYSQIEDLYNGE